MNMNQSWQQNLLAVVPAVAKLHHQSVCIRQQLVPDVSERKGERLRPWVLNELLLGFALHCASQSWSIFCALPSTCNQSAH